MSDYSFPKIPPPSYGQQIFLRWCHQLDLGMPAILLFRWGAIAAIITGNMAKRN